MSKIYVYSTLTADQVYTSYVTDPNGIAQPKSSIFIAGQANITNKNFVTPLGVVTEVTAEELAELKQNDMFKLHAQNGFISISEAKADPEVVAADMTGRDQSAPLVLEDLDSEDEAPVTNKPEAKSTRKPKTTRSSRKG